MRLGEFGWVLCLAGLPWSYFIVRLIAPFQTLDIWHANAWWMQGWLIVLAGCHAHTRRAFGVLPSAAWWFIVYTTLSLLWVFTSHLRPGQTYPSGMLLGMGNLWSILLGLLVMTTWTRETLHRITTAIFWSGAGLVIYGWLQVCNLDQFFRFVDASKKVDSLTGMIGNPTHFACQLALWIPFALIRPGWQKLWGAAAALLVMLTTSSTALAVVWLLSVAWVWRQSRRWAVGILGSGVLLASLVGLMYPAWLNPMGRLEVWKAWWGVLIERPILGWSVGAYKQLADALPVETPLNLWKHLHNEYLQLWVETGVIGLLLLGWLGWQLWQRRKAGQPSDLRWACGAAAVACALIGVLSFPFHLWQLGGWGLVAVSGWMITTS